METILSTALICILITAAVFFSARKLWRDKKNGKSCCSGDCSCCCGCTPKKKET